MLLHPDAGVHSLEPAERFTSMSVTRNAGATIPDQKPVRTVRPTLVVEDIPGAKPRALPPFQRPNFHDTADIEGARPKVLHTEKRNVPDFHSTRDIEHAAPRAVSFRTSRVVDPLAPVYPLPVFDGPAAGYEEKPLPYKRDLWRPDDIEGTKPNAYLRWGTRDHISASDIAGTTARARTGEGRHHHDILDVRDINEDGIYRWRRRTDPLRPTFTVHGRVVTDDDPGMYVKSSIREADPPRPFLPLTTADIEGAQANYQAEVPVGGIPPAKRRHYRVTNHIADISGSSAGTVRRGLSTLRMTDPLDRDYVLLDGTRPDAADMAIGKSWYNAAATVLAAEAAEASATLAMGRSGVTDTVTAPVAYATRLLDPRDAEVARLRGQVATLQKEKEVLSLTAQLGQLGMTSGMGATASAAQAEAEQQYYGGGANRQDEAEAAPPASAASSTATATATSRRSAPAGKPSRVSTAPAAAATQTMTITSRLGARLTVPAPPAAHEAGGSAMTATDDALAKLRNSHAAIMARNLLGVLPAQPGAQAEHLARTRSLGATRPAGRFDSTVDSLPATQRGEPPFAAAHAAAAAMSLPRRAAPMDTRPVRPVPSSYAAGGAGVVRSEKARDIADVRSLPS